MLSGASTDFLIAITYDHDTVSLILASVLLTVFVVVFCIACFRISRKAGFSAFISSFMFIPGVNILILILLGFFKWPAEKELAAYRKKYGPLEKKKDEYDNLPVCVKCQTPIPPGVKNCVSCGWPEKYKEF